MTLGCRWLVGPLLALALVSGGCRPSNPGTNPPAQTNPPPIRAYAANHAQPKLPTRKLRLGTQIIEAEIAASPAQLATGLMFRKSLAENEGMLCVFSAPAQIAFHMKNTSIPLSVAYLDRQGIILEIHDLKPFDEHPVVSRSDQVHYALEMNQGWFRRHAIGPAVVVRGESGPLGDLFRLKP